MSGMNTYNVCCRAVLSQCLILYARSVSGKEGNSKLHNMCHVSYRTVIKFSLFALVTVFNSNFVFTVNTKHHTKYYYFKLCTDLYVPF